MVKIRDLGIEVRIICDYKPCPEYVTEPENHPAIRDGNTHTAHCYVEARADVEYGIQIHVARHGPASKWMATRDNVLKFSVVLDGVKCESCVLSGSNRTFTFWGVIDTHGETTRQFCFAAISDAPRSDDDGPANQHEADKSPGSIQVVVQRGFLVSYVSPKSRVSPLGGALKGNELSLAQQEQAKATSLGTRTLAPVTVCIDRYARVKHFDTQQKPYATFNLKYRTRDDLQERGIIPSDSSAPTPAHTDDRGFGNLTKEENECLPRGGSDGQRGRIRSFLMPWSN